MRLKEILKIFNDREKWKVIVRFTDGDDEYNAGDFGFTDSILYNSRVLSAKIEEEYLYILVEPTEKFYE